MITVHNSDPWTVSIESKRLLIREFRSIDQVQTEQLMGNENTMRLFFQGLPYSPEQVASYVQSVQFKPNQPYGLYTIVEKTTDNFVGHLQMIREGSDVDMGIIFAPAYQRSKMGIEAVAALQFYIKHLRNQGFDFVGVVATAHPENYGSQKLLEFGGFRQTGSITKYGQPRNVYVMIENIAKL